jgi:hypothetical protein
MRVALVTDAWQPQVNGVVTTLVELVRELAELGHQVEVIHPNLFKTRPCPGYAGIDLAVSPKRVLTEKLDAFQPEAIHIATEGPLGWAARGYCLKRGSAFHDGFSHQVSRDPACGAQNSAVLGLCAVPPFPQAFVGRDGADPGRAAHAGRARLQEPAGLDARRGYRTLRL